MKKYLLVFAVACIGLFCASYDSEASAYETVTVTESFGSTGTTVTSYGSTGSAAVRRPFRPVRNVVRGTARVVSAPFRAVGSCR